MTLSKKKNVCIVSCSRADYGLLKKLIKLFQKDKNFNLNFTITGSHLSKSHGYTIDEIINDKIKIDHQINFKKFDGNLTAISDSISLIITSFTKILKRVKPNLVIILGDRFEILGVSLAALIARVPIAHIHGGELTEDSIDDSIRHAVTKLSNIHFVATNTYKKRIIQLGENPKEIFEVGGLGIDAIHSTNFIQKNKIEKKLDFKLWKKNIIVTFHPITTKKNISIIHFNHLLKAASQNKDILFIFTSPNIDHENQKLVKILKIHCNSHSNSIFFKSLGQLNYFSLLKHVDGVLGNSSSGLLEVPSFKKATINIGDRQKGRIKAESVLDCLPERKVIIECIEKIYTNEFQELLKTVKNPYDNGQSSIKIVDVLKNLNLENILKKEFYNISF